ncbi:MAG: histidinol-phosphate transaminase [candidate division KSB1 bacterium]|nr:histidinol-phosphate transaminase [candidate division KSB1 bacterium]MDZ7319857.1 histidinol-phosphate transaminase [candidate division KSB1 bacterium]MDZ7340544.1 histidinol-phosphate transaminase [candidate division KSB1 bacterium]
MPLVPRHIETLEPYQAGKSIAELQRQLGLKRIVKLASNENPLGASPKAIQAMIDSLAGIHRYPNPDCYDLRQALAERFDVRINNVITGHGSEGIMSVILRTFMLDDEEAISSEGTFIGFRVLAQSRGIQLRTVPLKDYRFDLEAIADQINEKTKIIYLANPNNPTGTIFTVREFLNFIKKVPPNVLIICDEAYFEFAQYDPIYPDSMKYRLDNVITLRTFSKAYGLAGIRIGYGFAHDHLINNLMKVKLPFEPSIPAQAAGLAALSDQDFVENYIKLSREGLEFFYDLFDRLGIPYIKSHANFVTIILESEARAAELNEKLLCCGVIVRPLKAFGLPNCIRITTGLEQENRFFARALKKVW